MHRLVVFALVISLGNTSVALAGETLAGVATRVAREVAVTRAPGKPKSAVSTSAQKNWASALAQDAPALSTSGMRKRTKLLIFLGTAAGIAAAAYVIDHKVEDNTPSSLGIRED